MALSALAALVLVAAAMAETVKAAPAIKPIESLCYASIRQFAHTTKP